MTVQNHSEEQLDLELDTFQPIGVGALAAVSRLRRAGKIDRHQEGLLAQAIQNLRNAIDEGPRALAACFPAVPEADTNAALAPAHPSAGEYGGVD